jgi:hypothetical protein
MEPVPGHKQNRDSDPGHIHAWPLAVLRVVMQATLHIEPTEFFMKRLLISGFVAVALLAVATTLRSYSISSDRSLVTTGVALSKKSPAAAGVTRLPIEEFEDMSLVFSTPTKP